MEIEAFKNKYNMSYVDIATMLGLGKQTIYQRKEYGWQMEYTEDETQIKWTNKTGKSCYENIVK
jgi:hypothetical protein